MEGEAASLSMCVNYWRSDRHREPQVTESWVRGNTTARLSAYLDERGFGMPRSMLDVGASVGVSTQFLHEAFPRSEVTGLDLSPYFVAMATYRARENNLPIRYIHANAEHTGLPSGSVDVITVNYMLHEVPTEATKRILSELHRVLRPGGVILICDLDGDKVRDNFVVSSFRKWAFEVTEPHIYQYYQNDLLENLAGVEEDGEGMYVAISMYEIYGQKVLDLLNDNAELKALEDGDHMLQLVGLASYRCDDLDMFMEIFDANGCGPPRPLAVCRAASHRRPRATSGR